MTGKPDDPDANVLDRLAVEARTENVIYGVIVSSAVMASVHGDSVRQLAVAVLVTMVIYWAAERYASVMASRIVVGSWIGWRELRRELGSEWELVTASFLPLVVLVSAHLLGASLSTSTLAALVCSTAVLSVAGWRVGSEAQLRPLSRLFAAAGAGAFGLVMIVLKSLLH
jgi:hypothetical protein